MITTNNYYSQPSFGQMNIPYSTEKSLSKLQNNVLQKLYDLGVNLDGTSFVDMTILPDLRPVIRGKLQKKGGIYPDFKFIQPEANSNILKVRAKGQKEVPYGHLDGDTVELNIPVRDSNMANGLFERFTNMTSEFEKAGLLTKIIDLAINEPNIQNHKSVVKSLSKRQLITNLMDRFGAWDNK